MLLGVKHMVSLDDNLNKMMSDLHNRHNEKKPLMQKYVELRLNKSVQAYEDDIQNAVSGIGTINTKRVVRKLTKSLKD